MSRVTWFDNYCEKIDSIWKRQFGDMSSYVLADREYDTIRFEPGHGRTKYKIKNTPVFDEPAGDRCTSSKIELQNKAAILHSRYDAASSALLEFLENFECKNQLLRMNYTGMKSAIDSLFEYFLKCGICEREELKMRLKDDTSLDIENYSRKGIIKSLDSGLASYMRGMYDLWIKKKENEFINGSFNDVLKIKYKKPTTEIKTVGKPIYNTVTGFPTQQLSFSEKWTEDKDAPIYFGDIIFTIAFDKAAINEKNINSLLKEVARFDCSEPVIFTPRYRRFERAAVTSALNYLENLGVIGKDEIEAQAKHGLTAALKGSVDKWLEAETIRNINELYE